MMYDIFSKSGNKIAEFTPGGPGCNYFARRGMAIDMNNPPAKIELGHCTAKLNPSYRLRKKGKALKFYDFNIGTAYPMKFLKAFKSLCKEYAFEGTDFDYEWKMESL